MTTLEDLIEATRNVKMTPEQAEEQRRSFAYGNTAIENELITREMIDEAAERETEMATDLYARTMAYDYGDADRTELMHKVWDGFPWMVNAYTGGYSNGRDREHEILHWCIENIGEPASPIHSRPGAWYRGGATINGWTFMGFAREDDMRKFMERWPAPEGVKEDA